MNRSSQNIDIQILGELRDATLPRLMLRAARAIRDRVIAELHKRGYTDLRTTHSALLGNLDIEGTRINILADRVGMTKQAMGQILVELEEKGYVERRVDPTDRRAKIVSVTQIGRQLMLDTLEIVRELEAEYKNLVGEQGMQVLREVLTLISSEAPLPDQKLEEYEEVRRKPL